MFFSFLAAIVGGIVFGSLFLFLIFFRKGRGQKILFVCSIRLPSFCFACNFFCVCFVLRIFIFIFGGIVLLFEGLDFFYLYNCFLFSFLFLGEGLD